MGLKRKLEGPNATMPVKKVPRNEVKSVKVEDNKTTQFRRHYPDSDGYESCVDEEHVCTTSYASNIEDIQHSPRALRAAMLKRRFAGIISKAQNGTLFQGDDTHLVQLKQEKGRLERRQHEEKARLESRIRAADSAARVKADLELKRQRAKQREAARLALEQVEQSVHIDDKFHTMRELESLIGSGPLFIVEQSINGRSCIMFDGVDMGILRSPLEQLGLSIKDEFMLRDYDDDDYDLFLQEQDLEEGEILFMNEQELEEGEILFMHEEELEEGEILF